MLKGIIFDLDGTLIDSMGIWYNIDRQFLRENGVDNPPEDISDRMKKMSVDESSEYFIKEFGLSCTKEYVIKRIEELVRTEYEENISLKPGVSVLLDYLDERGIPYGIATATYRRLAQAVLKRHGIFERFRFLLTDSEYPMGKKSPDIYIGAAERLALAPHETVVAEDALHCIQTASAAGFYTAGILDSHSEADREEIMRLSDSVYANIYDMRELFP